MRFILFLVFLIPTQSLRAQSYFVFFESKPKDSTVLFSENSLLDSTLLYQKKKDYYQKAVEKKEPFYKWLEYKISDSISVVYPQNTHKMPVLELETDSSLKFWQMYARVQNFNAENYLAQSKKVLSYLENNGYPFASISLDQLFWKKDTFQAKIVLDKGPFVTIDSIVIKGESKLINGVMRHQLGLKKGIAYQENRINRLQNNINSLPYVRTAREPAMLFSKEKNILYLYLEPKKASAFNALIGVNTNSEGQVQLTGEAEINLLNTFKKAERIFIQWRGPAPGQQNLESRFNYPFLFASPIGLQAGLSMFLQDSSFFSLNNFLGLRYHLGLNSSVGVAWQRARSGLLNNEIAQNQGFSEVEVNYLTLDYQWSKVNDFYIPTKGIQVMASVANGRNVANENSLLRLKTEASIEIYTPIYKQQKFFFKTQFFYLNGNNLAVNEAERTGGFKSIRGFNELSFFSNAHLINNFEYRVFIEQYSFINAFYDLGWLQIAQENRNITPLMSLGAGINLNTPQGLFTLLYAIGNTDLQGFPFNNSRVHIGFTNRF